MTFALADVRLIPCDVGFCVTPVWSGVDRAEAGGIVLPKSLAERAARAFKAGAAYKDARVLTDVNGKTFVSYSCLIMGRRANADLKRIGF